MPQVVVNSSNISVFQFSATFDPYQKSVTFDASATTGSGLANIQGAGFALTDQDGVVLLALSYSQITDIVNNPVYELDLSSLPVNFLFQTYAISGSIKDQNGNTYTTTTVYKKVCEPVNINESGYVPGMFQLTVDCVNNALTVKELTVLTYNNLQPSSTSKTGTLYYPTGTISNISFTNTPFTNNVVYTGQYRINCTTTATYDFGDDIFVDITYLTNNTFDATCSNKIADLMCCLVSTQSTYLKNCNNAIGKNAKQLLDQVSVSFLIGLTKEINGQDASAEADYIKKTLNCNCGATSVGQNEVTPINPSVYNIVLQGVGGITIPSTTVTGNTKTFQIQSNAYQVVKSDSLDLAFSITLDTSTPNVVKYKIAFDYNVMADYILTEFENTPSYIARLQALIDAVGVDLTGLDGSCVINLTQVSYALVQAGLTGSTTITNIVINGTTYNSPGLFASNAAGIQSWLNSLTLGTFSVVYNSGTLTIISNNNTNVVSTLTIGTPNLTIQFQATNATLVQVLQAIINYLCALTALQMALGTSLTVCYFNYDGTTISSNMLPTQSQASFNTLVSQAICNIVARIQTLSAVTCATIRALFADNSTAAFSGSGRLYGTDGSSCISFTNSQVALGVINSIQSDPLVKAAFCAIDCSSPATCPDISNTNITVVGQDIAIYGVTWLTTPNATQTVTVKYKLSSSGTYLTATNSLLILPNGNMSGTPPFLITGLTAGENYDVLIVNNCGGNGFGKQVTVPTSPVFNGSFKVGSNIYTVCAASSITLYSSSPFASGVTMYTDAGLTTPITGNIYIINSAGDIYNLNTSTGVVGADTLLNCTSGIAGTYTLGNDTGTICNNSPQTLYTGAPFAVGQIVYLDSGLTTPVTGYSFIVNNNDNNIFNLNSGTGQVGFNTGISCNVNTLYISNQLSGLTVTDPIQVGPTTINTTLTFGQIYSSTHVAFTGTIQIDFTGAVNGNAQLTVNGVDVECFDVNSPGTIIFSSRTYQVTDTILVFISPFSC